MREIIESLNTWVVYLLLFVVALVGSTLIMSIASGVQSMSERKKKTRTPSRLGCLVVFILTLTAMVLLTTLLFLRSFHVFTEKQLVAMIQCYPARDSDVNFEIQLNRVIKGQPQPAGRYEIKGQQWAVGGNIIKWEPWVSFVGMETMYRLSRLEGRYVKASDQQANPQTVYSLTETEESPFWNFIDRFGEKLPFIDAGYGNTTFNRPDYNETFYIYVTESGFMAQRKREP
jgi:hypothetical protein